MGLIKHYQIQEKGEILIERAPAETMRVEPERGEVLIDYPEELEVPKAQNEAERILKEAKSEAATIRDKAKQEGLNTGRVAGQEESKAKLKEALEVLNQAINERKKIIKDSESEILRLALKSAEQIIRSEVSLHRDVCLNIVSEAIMRVSDREQVIVRVNREDAEYIKRYKDRLSGILDGVKSFSVLEDATIEPGGCIVETNLGYVDARISTKLKSLEEALEKVRVAEDKK
jgi:flagellar assembly protein FliH